MNIKDEIKRINEDPYHYGKKTPINHLEKVLRKLSHHYYNTGKPLVTDRVFDTLKELLEKRDPSNSFLSEVGAPIEKNKIKLPHRMGSLDKITPDTEALIKWGNEYLDDYVLSDKLDGVSALLIYQKKKFRMYTRGNGIHGFEITHLIPFVLSSKLRKNPDLPENLAVRGELIISKKNFKKIEHKYANGRNAVAGLVNAKKYSETVADLTDFVAYNIYEPAMRISKQMRTLKSYYFTVVPFERRTELDNEGLSQLLIQRRKQGIYEIDGIVVAHNKKYPVSGGNPRHAFAFKAVLSDQMAETTIEKIDWNISMDGRLVPTVTVEPVKLVGVTIVHATAHNAKYVVDHGLGPGAVIKIIRSKDVIPYIQEVLSPAPNGKPSMPKYKSRWSKSRVDLFLDDPSKFQEVKIKQMAHFFKTMGVKHISEETIKKMVKAGFTDLPSLIQALKTRDQKLLEIEGLGEKMLVKIWEELQASLKRSYLYHLMAGSKVFGRGLGVEKLKLITQRYPKIMTKKMSTKKLMKKILAVEGFDLITADKFVDNFEAFKSFYQQLDQVVSLKSLKNFQKIKEGMFQGEKVVFTGFRNDELKEFIETQGGKVTGSVSSKTTILVYTDASSTKYREAQEKGIKLLSYDQFVKKYYEAKK